MELDKTIGHWKDGVTELDNLAYHLYCQKQLFNDDPAFLTQKSFLYWGKHPDASLNQNSFKFFDDANIIIRKEKIEKLKKMLDKVSNYNKKKLDRSKKKFLHNMSKDYFIPVRPTLLEIKRDKIKNIKGRIDG